MTIGKEDPNRVAANRIGFLNPNIIADYRLGRLWSGAVALHLCRWAFLAQKFVRQLKRSAIIELDVQAVLAA